MFSQYYEDILSDFTDYLIQFPTKKEKLTQLKKELDDDCQLLFMKAVTQMVASDVISVDYSLLVRHVKTILKALTTFEYTKDIPASIIFDYVLPYRVHDENFCLYSETFFNQIKPLVIEKSLEQAALEVNYWSLGKATYSQSNNRTQNALATINVGKGRCGEETVLVTCALRSVGIPARQVYCPFWSHCDDNHAWIEIWAGNKWKFMGACEPEEKLNYGWFNNAASRAGLVRHRIFGKTNSEINADGNKIFSSLSTTEIYGKTKNINVLIINKNDVVKNIKVGLYIINYNAPKLICEKTTDEQGKVIFEVGRGEYLVGTLGKSGYSFAKLNFNEIDIILDVATPTLELDFDLTPYSGDISEDVLEDTPEHEQKIKVLTEIRTSNHKHIDNNKYSHYINMAGDNKVEIENFLALNFISENEKEEILNLISEKDFSDITSDIIQEFLSVKNNKNYPKEIFNKYLSQIRVKDEPLYLHRKFVQKYFLNSHITSPKKVYEYLLNECINMDIYTYGNIIGDVKAVLTDKIITSKSLPIHVVQICRALNMVTRLSPIDDSMEYYDGNDFIPMLSDDIKSIELNVINNSKNIISYGKDFTISIIEDGYFKPFNFDKDVLTNDIFYIKKGLYAITSAIRQIDGSITAKIQFKNCDIKNKYTVSIDSLPDETLQKLLNIELPKYLPQNIGNSIYAYIENGCEPSEHFLNEIIENKEQILNKKIAIKLFAKIDTKNKILQTVLDNNLATFKVVEFGKDMHDFRAKMQIGDLRFPFITAVKDQTALYSFANYNVGTVGLLLKILN